MSKLPVETESTEELNRKFKIFNSAYEHSYKHYAQRHSILPDSWMQMTFKEVVALPPAPEQDYIYPEYMRNFLGYGIIHSYSREGTPGRSSKAGLALSRFHIAMRNVGHGWSLKFNWENIAQDSLRPEAVKAIEASGKSVDSWISEFRQILQWMESLDNPTHAALPAPDCCKDLSQDQLTTELTQRFAALSRFSLMINGKTYEVPNDPIPVHRTEFGDADSWSVNYNVPSAAVAWSIRPAGALILTRPEGSYMRNWLQNTIGVAEEAGRKVVALQHLFARHIPDLPPKDYDREKMKNALLDQRYWLKTAGAVEKILGNEAVFQAWETVVNLIGATALDVNFHSVSKAAVLLYTIVERLEQQENFFIKNKIHQSQKGPSWADTVTTVRELANKLSEIGIETEADLDAAKIKYARGVPDLYNGAAKHFFDKQDAKVVDLFIQHPEYESALKALKGYATGLQPAMQISEDAMHCITATLNFFDKYMPLTREESPLQQAHPRGR